MIESKYSTRTPMMDGQVLHPAVGHPVIQDRRHWIYIIWTQYHSPEPNGPAWAAWPVTFPPTTRKLGYSSVNVADVLRSTNSASRMACRCRRKNEIQYIDSQTHYLFLVALNTPFQHSNNMASTEKNSYLYVNRFFVCENSPNLCPTISCVTTTGR